MTLIEILIVLGLVALLTGGAMAGFGQFSGARLRQGATTITGAVNLAYARANATSRVVRLAIDLEKNAYWLEEAPTMAFVKRPDPDKLARTQSQAEDEAEAEIQSVLSAPKVARPQFKPVNEWGMAASLAAKGPKSLPDGIKFASVQSTHDASPKTEGKTYLYFWPGGQTERAVIELGRIKGDEPRDHLSVQVSPLTGRAIVKKGSVSLASLLENIEKRQRATGGI